RDAGERAARADDLRGGQRHAGRGARGRLGPRHSGAARRAFVRAVFHDQAARRRARARARDLIAHRSRVRRRAAFGAGGVGSSIRIRCRSGERGRAAMVDAIRVALIDDDRAVRSSLVQTLQLAGFEVSAYESAEQALAQIGSEFIGVVISDVRLPKMDGLALLQRVLQLDAATPVILITAHGDVGMAVQAMRAGAYDFIEKPFAPERLVEVTTRAIERRALSAEVQSLRSQLAAQRGIEAVLLGRSAAMQALQRQVQQLASTSADVMLVGETGTGKELVARCLHEHSARRKGHFVAINCGGLPDSLLESELFGHESGAFTSASRRRIGKIEHANGGTLLLDEIESMPLAFQVKLLRVLQERKVERLGSNDEIAVDVRVIAASKADLRELSAQQRFRSDLYYRLNVAE